MTDSTHDRVAALAARRSGSKPATSADTPRSHAPAPATPSPARRKRRPHAAAGGRILATGLSVSAALVMAGAMASARPHNPVVADTVVAVAPPATNPPIVVRIVMANGTTNGTANGTATAPAAPGAAKVTAPAPAPIVRMAPVTAKAVATSRAS